MPGSQRKGTALNVNAGTHTIRFSTLQAHKMIEMINFAMIRNGQNAVGGPKWTKVDLFRPKWTILVYFGLANAKIQFGIRPF